MIWKSIPSEIVIESTLFAACDFLSSARDCIAWHYYRVSKHTIEAMVLVKHEDDVGEGTTWTACTLHTHPLRQSQLIYSARFRCVCECECLCASVNIHIVRTRLLDRNEEVNCCKNIRCMLLSWPEFGSTHFLLVLFIRSFVRSFVWSFVRSFVLFVFLWLCNFFHCLECVCASVRARRPHAYANCSVSVSMRLRILNWTCRFLFEFFLFFSFSSSLSPLRITASGCY